MRVIDNEGGGTATAIPTSWSSESATPQSKSKELNQESSREGRGPELVFDQIWEWNRHVPPLIQRCVHNTIAQQAESQPDAIAIQSWDGTLTYSELNNLSSRLAYYLVSSRSISMGTIIPLCFEKSMWAVVSVLAVMKAGATFSLTDPSQPEARLQTIVQQTEAKLIIVSSAQNELGQRIAGAEHVLTVSRDFLDTLSAAPPDSLPQVPSSTSMYIIFTSGSTGKPKGVVISHENYTSGAIPRADAVGYKSTSRCFDFPSYAFDVSIDCMLCTLLKGGRVCVPSEEARMNDLSGAIRDSGANMVHMTPSVARVLDPDIIPSLDVLGLGGEAVSSSDAATWSRETNLVIAYGPSECTVGCTINNRVAESTGIGRGVGGVTWIVNPDNHDELMAKGEVGELIIEGPVVGVGYLGEPEKTAEVFINDPSWLVSGRGEVPGRHGRLYKTGDLVCYEPNGLGGIEFVGRKDQQVKLRGQRVELAEVEHHLQASLPAGVKVVAEVVKPDQGVPTLVAFLSEKDLASDGTAGVDEQDKLIARPSPELSGALSKIGTTMGSRVPRYMIPASFVALREIPSLVSRKVDRKKLRQLGATLSRKQFIQLDFKGPVETEEPATDIERLLQKSWALVLGSREPIYRQSNFFQLGGDSLRAMKLLAAARDDHLVLTVSDIFTYPTLAEMASRATTAAPTTRQEIAPFSLLEAGWERGDAVSQVSAICGIDSSLVEDIYPCTPLQEALMALSAKFTDAYIAQRVVGLDSREAGERLVNAFTLAHEDCPILRTRITQISGRGLVQVVTKQSIQCHYGNSLSEYLSADKNEPMDLGKALVRYALIEDLATGKVSFVLTMHHALYDGWSMPLVVERVDRAYNGKKTTRPADFKHFIDYLMKKDGEKSADYWRANLEGANGPQFPSLPHPGYQTKADSLLELYVPLDRTASSSFTAATIIRAAWALVASQYINTDDVVFGETLTGRNAPVSGAEEIEGPMITTVPVRIQIERNAPVEEYLQAVQKQSVEQIPHEHFGLQHIRRLSPDALEACELRMGLVMHPSTASTEESARDSATGSPASRLVPADDAEAAQEALKFNTYALMLVCSIDPQGFLIMASFDSNTVGKTVMERVLEQLKQTCQSLSESLSSHVQDISIMTADDVEHVDQLATRVVTQDILDEYPSTNAVYIVDTHDSSRLVPFGGIGEAVLSSPEALKLPEANRLLSGKARHYKTSRLARYTTEGRIEFIKDGSVKVDALETSNTVSTERILARSGKQKKLRSIWSRVLRVPEEEIGLNDDFFNLGGDSITAMKLVSEARSDGITLTVMQIFKQRTLYDMSNALKEVDTSAQTSTQMTTKFEPFSLLDIDDRDTFLDSIVRPQLAKTSWEVENVIPARLLQEIAVRGTTHMPRFSARYEHIYFDQPVDKQKLFESCQTLVSRNEILRTVFIQSGKKTLSVVLKHLKTDIVEYNVDANVKEFANKLCHLDVLTTMPLGSAFVKWFFIQGSSPSSSSSYSPSCLIFRISHAQYDEICLPILLRQLSTLYQGQQIPEETVPFSSYVGHVIRHSIPESIPYWRQLLQGSSITTLKPTDMALERKNHFAIERAVDISMRPRFITPATLPTAAWALCLARRLSLRDVTFGEVVSGRNLDVPDSWAADTIVGPCWQYVPVRVAFGGSWTGADLLRYVQDQHVASSAHECMSIDELKAHGCADSWADSVDWFDTVVHQDVDHVENLGLEVAGGGTRLETLYVQEEPLREWKIQAFFSGGGEGVNDMVRMTLEIVTFESWAGYAKDLLDDLVEAARILVEEPGSKLFPGDVM